MVTNTGIQVNVTIFFWLGWDLKRTDSLSRFSAIFLWVGGGESLLFSSGMNMLHREPIPFRVHQSLQGGKNFYELSPLQVYPLHTMLHRASLLPIYGTWPVINNQLESWHKQWVAFCLAHWMKSILINARKPCWFHKPLSLRLCHQVKFLVSWIRSYLFFPIFSKAILPFGTVQKCTQR